MSVRLNQFTSRLAMLSAAMMASCHGAETLPSADPARMEMSASRLSAITEMLEEEVDSGRIAGAVAAVARRGHLVYQQSVGRRSLTAAAPMTDDTIFRIASMTKPITSVAVLQLVERQKIALDAPVSDCLPEFSGVRVLRSVDGDALDTVAAEHVPTIHDLLTHRSGLTYGWFGPKKLDAEYRRRRISDFFTRVEERLQDRVTRIADLPLKFQPGTAWDYGVSTDVLGRVVEVVSGEPLDDYFRHHIFTPLGMSDTYFTLPVAKHARLAGLCTPDDAGRLTPVGADAVTAGFLTFTADSCLPPNAFFAGGSGLVSTTSDYLRFLQMLLNGGVLNGSRVLSPESVAMMTQNQIGAMTITLPGHGDGFGLGVGVLSNRAATGDAASVGTFSWGGIFNTCFWVDPQQDLIGVLMTQIFPWQHLNTRARFRQLAYESLETIPQPAAASSPHKIPRGVQLDRTAVDATADNRPCYRITTPTATWYLDKVGAGLSSMLDADGNDWIGFHPQEGSGAAGEYRGFPNAVFREAGSYFHPLNNATDPCVTFVQEETPNRVVIAAISSNNLWEGRYTFTPDSCTFTMTKKPADHSFWVLYEGTPGGSLDATDWWMTSHSEQKQPLTTNYEGDIPQPEWIAFGDSAIDRALVLHHVEDDAFPDRFYQMQNQMTVFGFGRRGMQKYLSSVPQTVSIRFVESTNHAVIQQHLAPDRSAATASSTEKPQTAPPATSVRQAYEQFALTHPGNTQLGQKLFFDDLRTRCSSCHRVNQRGGRVGPDLSRIGGKFDRPHLIESLIEPSRQIVEGYRTTVLATADGQIHVGIVQSEDDQQVTLVDQRDRSVTVAVVEIEERREAALSLMPTGLSDQLSPEEFTGLIAYLETLSTGKASFGSGTTGPIQVPPGFTVQTIATGLSGATALDVTPDGRVLICEQHGALRVVQNDKLREEPLLTIPVEHFWERGLIGVTVAEDFPADPWVFVVYVSGDPHPHHRISRFRVEGNQAVPGSEEVLLAGDNQNDFGGNVPAGHQGGAIHFGGDGKLYIGIGEQTAKTPAQRMDALQGKILRLNPDGSIPDDNPFLSQTRGKYQSIWAIGCRNPFTFAVRRSSGQVLINDVGGKYEEINPGVAGANYGWPTVEHGITTQAGITNPIHIYPQASVSGGDFSDNARQWPAEYRGKYFFADFVHGWIRYLDPDNPQQADDFASGLRRVVDLRFAPDGSLYVLLRNAWVVDDKFKGGTSALMKIDSAPDSPGR